ncbi:hypothetical protein MKEN_01311300 [Mycena kentingensis (nom. inval.)]|nr:hypothetical protein MKEN_01311300 [Mycena kentingensis (nom. inval.)]
MAPRRAGRGLFDGLFGSDSASSTPSTPGPTRGVLPGGKGNGTGPGPNRHNGDIEPPQADNTSTPKPSASEPTENRAPVGGSVETTGSHHSSSTRVLDTELPAGGSSSAVPQSEPVIGHSTLTTTLPPRTVTQKMVQTGLTSAAASPPSRRNLNTPLIAGTIAGFLGIALLIFFVLLLRRRTRARRSRMYRTSSPIPRNRLEYNESGETVMALDAQPNSLHTVHTQQVAFEKATAGAATSNAAASDAQAPTASETEVALRLQLQSVTLRLVEAEERIMDYAQSEPPPQYSPQSA